MNMTEQFVKYCCECKWIHSEDFKPGLNVSTTVAMPDDELLHLCNQPNRRHLVTGKPVVMCSRERENHDSSACGLVGKLWEKADD